MNETAWFHEDEIWHGPFDAAEKAEIEKSAKTPIVWHGYPVWSDAEETEMHFERLEDADRPDRQ